MGGVLMSVRSLLLQARVRLVALAVIAAAGALLPAAAWGLPEGRVYEMVSPVYKGGHGVAKIEAVASNGESVGFFSTGTFAGAPSPGFDTLEGISYIARRGASGWTTEATMPPSGLLPFAYELTASATLGTVVAVGKPGPNWEITLDKGLEAEVLLHPVGLPDTTGNWEVDDRILKGVETNPAPVNVNFRGGSPDLCHLILHSAAGSAAALTPEALGASNSLYELASGCAGEPPSLRLVGLNDQGRPLNATCPYTRETLGDEEGGGGEISDFNAVAADGREIFFTAPTEKGGCGKHQLFVRLNGERTLEVSRPLSPKCGQVLPCPGAAEHLPAQFMGASEDGSRVFFKTATALTGEGEPGALYMAKIGCPGGEAEACAVAKREVTALVEVSHDAHVGEAADVQGVVSLAPDGSRAYFVARGVLSQGPNPQGGIAVHDADDLYVYDSVSGDVEFIAELCSGPGISGTVEDSRCPASLSAEEPSAENDNDTNLWLGQAPEAQTAGADGQFLVFSTYAQLAADDTDSARDIYRYDAETGALERVSLGEAGYDANGNNSAFNAHIAGYERYTLQPTELLRMGTRAVSEDGSRIVFTTAEPLSPEAGNGLENVYEWQAGDEGTTGAVSLVSSGTGDEAVEDVVIDTSGQNIFFVTSQRLVPQDTDGAQDVYDARLEGGFPVVQARTQPCAGDGCQGPLTNPAPLLVPGSAVQAPGESVVPSTPVAAPTKKETHKKTASKKSKTKKTKPKRRPNPSTLVRHARVATTAGRSRR
jgi:hypothetical protein